jgi:DNA transposition AAA+ family ATPase
MMIPGCESEVAQILAKIEAECVAAQRGMTGFAESARHECITARLENMGRLHEQLRTIVGDEATRLFVERLETIVVE